MKYYIVLQPSIRSMGGEEMYTRNIVLSAKDKGYTPIVLHSAMDKNSKVYIDDLKPFEQYGFPEFRYEPCVVPGTRKRKLLKRLRNILSDCEDCSVIESHEILVAEWGEWIAEKLKIHHFAYMLIDCKAITFQPLYDFFIFKYARHELASFAQATLPGMFQNYVKNIKSCSLPAYCTNVYEDISLRKEFELEGADFTIGSIGRTNKRCVQPMIDSIIRFVDKHGQNTFNVLYIGGSTDESSEQKVVQRLSSLPNVNLVFTGLLFPIPIKLIRKMDVCLATSGSCRVSKNCGIPTISLDSYDGKAIGVLGKTTESTLSRSIGESPIDVEDLLEEILINNKYKKEDKVEPVDVDFSSHWDFITNMDKEKEYYNIDTIQYPLKRRVISLLLGYYYGLSKSSCKYHAMQKLIQSLT